MEDNRKKFKNEYWEQGRLLDTPETLRMNELERIDADFEERHFAFINFTERDNGRSRQLVHRYSSDTECEQSVEKHNKDLEKRLKKLNQ